MGMGFVREVRSRETAEAITQRTQGMVRLAAGRVRLAPRPCPACHGAGARSGGRPCAFCGGAGTTRRLVADDPSHPVLVQGPCGLGQQRLVAVALADGRPALVHFQGPVTAGVYVAAAGPAPARPVRHVV
jgi:hypothetical protein